MEAVLKKNESILKRLLKSSQIEDIRFDEFDDGYIVSNNYCDYHFLTKEEFENLKFNNYSPFPVRSQDEKVKLYRQLHSNNCFSTVLHIFIVGLDCPLHCIYCQADAGINRRFSIMNEETASNAINLALQTPSDFIQVEFQGGEPLSNFSIVEYIVNEFNKRIRKSNKNVEFSLVTSLFGMTEKKLSFIKEQNISIAISFDGTEYVHNKNRPADKGNNYKNLIFWLDKIKNAGIPWKTSFILTATKDSLRNYEKIIENYISIGAERILFRPLGFFGRAKENWDNIGYSPSEFGYIYEQVLNLILDKSIKENIKLIEYHAAMFAKKILLKYQINHTEFRSPCGAGIGQIVYDWNGNIYPCDEARMVAVQGDEIFKLGNVTTSTYLECLSNEIIESLCVSSTMESMHPCCDCVYMPLCGICPVYNYSTYKSLQNLNERNDYLCNIKKEMFRAFFSIFFKNDLKSKHLHDWANE